MAKTSKFLNWFGKDNPFLMNKITTCLLLSVLFFLTCNTESVEKIDELAHIKDQKVKNVLGKILKASGELRHWNNLSQLRYNKYFKLYTETGEIEKDVRQSHKYLYHPKTVIEIETEEGDLFKKLVYNGKMIQQKINGQVDTETDSTALMNQLQTSLFVIGLPFKLADEGIDLSYEGTEKLEGRSEVHVLKAVFNPTSNANHTTQDIWWLYFHKKSYLMEGYLVKHKDHYSLVQNETSLVKGGFNFPVKRKSWRSDANRKKLYLRAEYDYASFSFDVK